MLKDFRLALGRREEDLAQLTKDHCQLKDLNAELTETNGRLKDGHAWLTFELEKREEDLARLTKDHSQLKDLNAELTETNGRLKDGHARLTFELEKSKEGFKVSQEEVALLKEANVESKQMLKDLQLALSRSEADMAWLTKDYSQLKEWNTRLMETNGRVEEEKAGWIKQDNAQLTSEPVDRRLNIAGFVISAFLIMYFLLFMLNRMIEVTITRCTENDYWPHRLHLFGYTYESIQGWRYEVSAQCEERSGPWRKAKGRDFEIQPIDGKGMAAVAQRDIPRGDAILEDQPLLTIPCQEMERLKDSDIEAMILTLPPEKQESFWDLFDAEIDGSAGAKSRVLTNSFPVPLDDEGTEAMAVFNTVARFNHSCVPNVHNSWNMETKTETLYAVRDIAKGQELCTTYLNPNDLYRPCRERRGLLQRLKFTCGCEACRLDGAHKQRSDEMREELGKLASQLDSDMADVEVVRQRVMRSVKLIDQEMKGNPALKCRTYSAAFELAAELGALDLASEMAQLALDNVLLAEGYDSPRALMLQQCVDLCG
eukprot:s349_g26.t3